MFLFFFQITIQRDSGLDVSAPKHGKVDLNNAPHVGGNQWAGGTGKPCFLTVLTGFNKTGGILYT